MAKNLVIQVGNCGYDGSRIAKLVQRAGGECIECPSAADARRVLQECAERAELPRLILINRILDGDGSEGVNLIVEFKGQDTLSNIPCMLISNYEWAQDAAREKGAVEGFGKGSLAAKETQDRVAQYFV